MDRGKDRTKGWAKISPTTLSLPIDLGCQCLVDLKASILWNSNPTVTIRLVENWGDYQFMRVHNLQATNIQPLQNTLNSNNIQRT